MKNPYSELKFSLQKIHFVTDEVRVQLSYLHVQMFVLNVELVVFL